MATVLTTPRPAFRLDVHTTPEEQARELADDVRAGLASNPRALPPKYFYDEVGCALFEEITTLPEYYQTRTELRILEEVAPGVVARHRPAELVELGSGSSRKTTALLEPMAAEGLLRRYVPFDIAPGALLGAASRVADRYPGIDIHGVAGDFGTHLDRIPEHGPGRRMVAFLGGTIGNLLPAERVAFLDALRGLLEPGDVLLIGTDLVADTERTRLAYDDPAGVTAAFNRNVLSVLNRELGADFEPTAFEHVASYDRERAWIEMRLRATRHQTVTIPAVGLILDIGAGESIRTEVSCKFTRRTVRAMYEDAGLDLVEWHTDPERRFAVSIARAG